MRVQLEGRQDFVGIPTPLRACLVCSYNLPRVRPRLTQNSGRGRTVHQLTHAVRTARNCKCKIFGCHPQAARLPYIAAVSYLTANQ